MDDSRGSVYSQESAIQLFHAVQVGNLGGVRSMIRDNPDLVNNKSIASPEGYFLLGLACGRNRLAVAQFLLEQGAEVDLPNHAGITALCMLAIYSNHLVAAQLLLDHGANIEHPCSLGRTPLFWASIKNNLVMAQFLLDKGANINCQDNGACTALFGATSRGHLDMAQLLLDRGADINHQNKNGETPLHLTIAPNHLKEGRLMSHQAELTRWMYGGPRPSYHTTWQCSLEMVRFLLDQGANIECQNICGETCLSWAARNGHSEVAQLLLDRGANIEHQDINGHTPLFMASQTTDGWNVTKILLGRGVNINHQDKEGKTPLDYALQNGRQENAFLLVKVAAQKASVSELKQKMLHFLSN